MKFFTTISMVFCLTFVGILLGISSCKTKPIPNKKRPDSGTLPNKALKNTECVKKPIVVAIIDTGFGFEPMHAKAKLCRFGHKDFTDEATSNEFGTKDEVPVDETGHGTHIAGIIDSFGKKTNVEYCLVIIKYYSPDDDDWDNAQNSIKAINYAKNIRADYINYSGGGDYPNSEETEAVKTYLDQGGKFVASAGNDKRDIGADTIKLFYPAMSDKRVIVVGAVDENGENLPFSNYGKTVTRKELGLNVQSFGYLMTGTSQAAAIATGKMLAQEKNICK